MDKNKRVVICLILSVFFAMSLVSSQSVSPIVEQSSLQNGLVLRMTDITPIRQNMNHLFAVHVFNASNGLPMTSGVLCNLHMYGQDGEHIFKHNDFAVSDGYDFEFNVTGGNFTSLGEYYIHVQCNNSDSGGFISIPVDVIQPQTIQQNEAQSIGSFSYLMMLIFITAFLGYLGFKLSDSEKLWVMGLLFIVMCLFMVIYDVWVGYEYQQTLTEVGNAGMMMNVFIMLIISIGVGLTIAVVIFVRNWKKIKKAMIEAWNEEEEEDDDWDNNKYDAQSREKEEKM